MKRLLKKRSLIIIAVVVILVSFASVVTAMEVKDSLFNMNPPTYISLNTTAKGVLESKDDYEAYIVTATRNGALSVNLNHEGVGDSLQEGFKVSVYHIENADEDWYEYKQLTYFDSFFTDVTDSWGELGIAPGTYCIVVEPGQSVLLGDFEIKVSFSPTESFEKEFNDTMETATTLNVNRTVYGSSGQREEGTDTDYFKFVLREDRFVNVFFRHDDSKLPQVGWVMKLLTEDGREVASYASKYQDPELSTGTINLHAGTYYVLIESQVQTGATYRLEVESGETTLTEFEINDSPEEAEILPENTEVSGALAPKVLGLDKDYYKISLAEESYITVNFKHALDEEEDNDYNGWNVRLLRPEEDGTYTEIVKRISKWTDEGVSITGMGLPKGDYYILVDADSMNYSARPYTLSYVCQNDVLYEHESNNTKETANEVELMKTYYGSLISTDMTFDRDFYKFNVDRDRNIAFEFYHDYSNDSALAWVATIIDEAGNEIASVEASKNDHVINTGVIELTEGNYYILIENDLYASEDTYWFKIIA